jgi:outer membrane lipoprotein-sorting protein
MKIWARGEDYALVRIVEGGPRETGMMTLKRERQLWNYLPQAGRVMKLPAGMLGDSWMGSDFTNDDLVNGSSLVADFDAKVLGVVDQDGRKAWRLELVPRASAAVVWGRIELVLDRAACVPLVERFYDEEGKLARTMTLGDLRTVGWRQFPARMSVKPEEGGRETTIQYDDIQLDVAVPDETFTLRRLQQGR